MKGHRSTGCESEKLRLASGRSCSLIPVNMAHNWAVVPSPTMVCPENMTKCEKDYVGFLEMVLLI